jgi:hypothetical protein
MCRATVGWYGAVQGMVVEEGNMHGYGTVRLYCTSIMTGRDCIYGLHGVTRDAFVEIANSVTKDFACNGEEDLAEHVGALTRQSDRRGGGQNQVDASQRHQLGTTDMLVEETSQHGQPVLTATWSQIRQRRILVSGVCLLACYYHIAYSIDSLATMVKTSNYLQKSC